MNMPKHRQSIKVSLRHLEEEELDRQYQEGYVRVPEETDVGGYSDGHAWRCAGQRALVVALCRGVG